MPHGVSSDEALELGAWHVSGHGIILEAQAPQLHRRTWGLVGHLSSRGSRFKFPSRSRAKPWASRQEIQKHNRDYAFVFSDLFPYSCKYMPQIAVRIVKAPTLREPDPFKLQPRQGFRCEGRQAPAKPGVR